MGHYRDVIACCKKNGIEPVVTLHHFSSPAWLISKGGWEADTTPADFARYTRYVLERMGPELSYICTINEANMGIQVAAIAQQYMKQMMSSNVQMGLDLEKLMAGQALAAAENMAVFGTEQPQCFTSPRTPHGDEIVIAAHKEARAVIRELCPAAKVGLTLSLYDIQAQPGGEEIAAKKWVDEFAHYLPAISDDDFLGVQNYTRCRIGPEGELPAVKNAELTQMDYEFYPDGLEHVLRRVAREFTGELLVTENGIATGDDARRVAYIRAATDGVARCVTDGLPVKGYFYWSLLDNFEWQKGYGITFGLIAVDRATQHRTPKSSLAYLGSLQ